jgi:hypothetical protein
MDQPYPAVAQTFLKEMGLGFRDRDRWHLGAGVLLAAVWALTVVVSALLSVVNAWLEASTANPFVPATTQES